MCNLLNKSNSLYGMFYQRSISIQQHLLCYLPERFICIIL